MFQPVLPGTTVPANGNSSFPAFASGKIVVKFLITKIYVEI